MIYIGIFLGILILFLVPWELLILVAVLATAIYFWNITLIISLIALSLYISYILLKFIFKAIGAIFTRINSFLDGEESVYKHKDDVNIMHINKEKMKELDDWFKEKKNYDSIVELKTSTHWIFHSKKENLMFAIEKQYISEEDLSQLTKAEILCNTIEELKRYIQLIHIESAINNGIIYEKVQP